MVFNKAERDERLYLEEIKQKLNIAIDGIGEKVDRYAQVVRDQKEYLWDHRGEMDHIEKIAARDMAEQSVRTGQAAVEVKRRLKKLAQSPYFGRFDFISEGGATEAIYVGTHSFMDDATLDNIIFDWRAPIASMFYDFELGDAFYSSPSGDIRGEIELKRQFKIRDGQMEFMLESGLNILDDVLQEELSRASEERMKNIVATIQRDQNAIIRNEDAEVLVIQGVAGSGKTSIALHRIAFLLYRFKETLSSKDIFILSPNKVFADFISSVLPELGEEQISEIEIEELADELLGRKFSFQTRFEQSMALLEGKDKSLIDRVCAKASKEFLADLDAYIGHVEASRFQPTDLSIRDKLIKASFLKNAFKRQSSLSLKDGLRLVFESVEQEAWARWRYELSSKERVELRTAIRKMGRNPALRTLYREFFKWTGKPELYKTLPNSKFEYSDVFPLIYLKLHLEWPQHDYQRIKHLVIDEMQDYTPVQYQVISMLFRCNKTILGDVNQSLNGWMTSTAEAISELFPYSECVKLFKSYRSSYEITQFAQGISSNPDLIAIERHADKPHVVRCKDESTEQDRIVEEVKSFLTGNLQTMGIICKTQTEAEALFDFLQQHTNEIHLLSPESKSFIRGVVVCSAYLSKGLEFDHVLIPFASDKNYSTPLEKKLLYVAATRARHTLTLTYMGVLTRFVKDETLYNTYDVA